MSAPGVAVAIIIGLETNTNLMWQQIYVFTFLHLLTLS
jgi:hypothetical protein